MLHVDLVREVPEALKPRQIEISRAGTKAIEAENRLIRLQVDANRGRSCGAALSFMRAGA